MPSERPATGPGPHVGTETLGDLDEDLLAPAKRWRVRRHLARCADCRRGLESLAAVRTALAGAPAEPIPPDVAARLEAAFAAARAPVPAPRAERPGRRIGWPRPSGGVLAGAAAASVLLLFFGALVLGQLNDPSATTSGGGANQPSRRSAAAPPAHVAASGQNYDAAGVRAAVPGLVAQQRTARQDAVPTAGARAPAGLSRLRDPSTLAACVMELSGTDRAVPLAVDLARYAGKPAAVVVLPETGNPAVLDIWVVGPACSRGDPQLLYFTRLPRPAGIGPP